MDFADPDRQERKRLAVRREGRRRGDPHPPPAPASRFDRSWSAAVGAFEDQGVRITAEDRSAGVLRGTRDAIDVSAYVRTQADGSVRVEFNTAGATSRDPDLINRVTRSDDHGRSKCADEGAQADDPFADQG
jgi:hypothetical protein